MNFIIQNKTGSDKVIQDIPPDNITIPANGEYDFSGICDLLLKGSSEVQEFILEGVSICQVTLNGVNLESLIAIQLINSSVGFKYDSNGYPIVKSHVFVDNPYSPNWETVYPDNGPFYSEAVPGTNNFNYEITDPIYRLVGGSIYVIDNIPAGRDGMKMGLYDPDNVFGYGLGWTYHYVRNCPLISGIILDFSSKECLNISKGVRLQLVYRNNGTENVKFLYGFRRQQ